MLQLPEHNSLPIHNEGRRLHPAELESCFVQERCQKKNGIMWEKFPSGGPPPRLPPVWEFSHFFTVFLPFYKPLNWKNREKYGVGLGQTPPPFWEFSHIIPFFFDHVPKAYLTLSNEHFSYVEPG